MILSEQTRDGRRFRIVVQEWYGVEWGSANARDEAVRHMVRELIEQAESGQKGGEPLNTIGLQQELIGDLLHENQRIRTFVEKVRMEITRYAMSWASWHSMKEALAELDAKPAPVAETAEGGT